MQIELYFFIIFLITILVTRTFLYFNPIPSPTVNGFRMHHYMYGIVLAPTGIALGNVTIFAIGTGLFIDELGYLLIGGKNHEDNYSKKSLILLLLFIIGTYIFREQFLFWK